MARKFTKYPSNYVKASKRSVRAAEDVGARVKSRYDGTRDLLGEDEWYYIEDYILNEDNHHPLNELMTDVDAWQDYCDWKLAKHNKKAALSASTRLKIAHCLIG